MRPRASFQALKKLVGQATVSSFRSRSSFAVFVLYDFSLGCSYVHDLFLPFSPFGLVLFLKSLYSGV